MSKRRVFFSFDYDDVWKVNQVRNINQFESTNTFHDHADLEQVKKQDDASVKKWIDGQLNGASVTCVLIGTNTHQSKWIKYEIQKSFEQNKGIFAIHINNIKDKFGNITTMGKNPLSLYQINNPNGTSVNLTQIYKTYQPANYDEIKLNIEKWIDTAFNNTGK